MSPTNTLYRFFDSNDALLYVGLTINPGRRLEKHRDEKPWWPDVARITMEQHPDLATLRLAERVAIETEKPSHNIRMNGVPEQRNGRASAHVISSPDPLPLGVIGHWFHSYAPVLEAEDTAYLTLDGNGNKREWQGQIVARDGGLYVAQLYSWWDGMPSIRVLVDVNDMKPWKFFPSNEAMQIADGCIENRRGWRCHNPCTHVIRDWSGGGSIYRCWDCIEHYNGTVEALA